MGFIGVELMVELDLQLFIIRLNEYYGYQESLESAVAVSRSRAWMSFADAEKWRGLGLWRDLAIAWVSSWLVRTFGDLKVLLRKSRSLTH
jgi:hypothetical protein